MTKLSILEADQKDKCGIITVKGNMLDLHLEFGLMKINIVNEFKYLMIAFTDEYQVI